MRKGNELNKMSDSSDSGKYKWTPDSTTLLVSVWTDKQVQKQLQYTTKPQLIWESIARYMRKKGYNVNGKQCRSRMKQVLVCYREAKRAGTRAGVEQYYESIDKVLKTKQVEQININGVDTVDTTANVKSPPKDVKTNKNLQMRYKYQEPIGTMLRTEALSPAWQCANEEDYPDSPESNETVLAQPYRALSPVRDAATNTGQQLTQPIRTTTRPNSLPVDDSPIRENYRPNMMTNNRFSEIPFQNAVQNVQNQIIQENMQQNQAMLQHNILQNYLPQQEVTKRDPIYQQNLLRSVDQGLLYNQMRLRHEILQANIPNAVPESNLRTQNQLQRNVATNNGAMPQEPKKPHFRQNLSVAFKQYQDTIPAQPYTSNVNQMGNEKSHNLNETYVQPMPTEEPQFLPAVNDTCVTTNATYNDDNLSIEFLQESPTPEENGVTRLKESPTMENTTVPNAPARKKKTEKLEQLMISAINSQNEVVNKILAAQTDMVTKFLDLDRDRQQRLENRLDHLLHVVHTSVLSNNQEKAAEITPPLSEPMITNLDPPPKPGVIPPKLDLVPPKPCRVPCTVANSNVQLINQNPIQTKPGVVSPLMSPNRKMGQIWTKLGPVSQSPFVKAQQQLGLRQNSNTEARTQSSAERRIAKQIEFLTDTKNLIFETTAFLGMERQVEERIKNSRIQENMREELAARNRLVTDREPTPAMILTAAFLDAECKSSEGLQQNWTWNRYSSERRETQNVPTRDVKFNFKETEGQRRKFREDDLLTGHGESYERLRQLNIGPGYARDPMDSSTPAKPPRRPDLQGASAEVPRQTIQQLAQLVMNSARWRNNATEGQHVPFAQTVNPKNEDLVIQDQNLPANRISNDNPVPRPRFPGDSEGNPTTKSTAPWSGPSSGSLERYSYEGQTTNRHSDNAGKLSNNVQRLSYNSRPTNSLSMGFTTEMLDAENQPEVENRAVLTSKQIGFVTNNDKASWMQNIRSTENDKGPFTELQKVYSKRAQLDHALPYMTSNGNPITPQEQNMIDRYVYQLKEKEEKEKETDSDKDEEFLDTTGTLILHPGPSRRESLTSIGTATSSKTGQTARSNCVIS
ncbi:uncharacterized protein LOC105696033 isoform X2 [Orussus abietinus]|uniref:uncharacterized protein LOC105696033 isoform X2 n=1 Tax=Orussus abietinus TaxID=222816 RepID=UPI000625FA54|nr:uncharacterized protein LOC105696033 isoform X2 [Orussus abietinus]